MSGLGRDWREGFRLRPSFDLDLHHDDDANANPLVGPSFQGTSSEVQGVKMSGSVVKGS
jgi:hypothetical protein